MVFIKNTGLHQWLLIREQGSFHQGSRGSSGACVWCVRVLMTVRACDVYAHACKSHPNLIFPTLVEKHRTQDISFQVIPGSKTSHSVAISLVIVTKHPARTFEDREGLFGSPFDGYSQSWGMGKHGRRRVKHLVPWHPHSGSREMHTIA